MTVVISKGKGKVRPGTGHEDIWGVDVYLYSFFNLGATWGWVVNATPRPLYRRERDPVPILQKAGWAMGPVWVGAKNLALSGTRFQDRQARSESLYQLSYRCPLKQFVV